MSLAIAIDKRGRIAAVGDTADLTQTYPNTSVKRLNRKFVYPGFIDAHVVR